jgi:XRE family transcriptional regulator, regulator of sulfur utilization
VATDICGRFGQRLCQLREQRDWDQADLAVHSGIGRVHISQLENGKEEPGLRTLEIIALSFDLSVSDLLRDI